MLPRVEHAFGRGAPFALGMEEELLLVDPHSHAITPRSTEIVARAHARAGEVKYDVYEGLVETATPVSGDAAEAAGHLRRLREALKAAGATLLGAGIHPQAPFGDVVHVDQPRYQEIAGQLRGLVRRTPTCALHVHVAMPDPETAVAALNRIRVFLPLLQALAANSPFWHGLDSGFATARAQLFRGYPRAVIPRAMRDWEDYTEIVQAIVAAGDLPDYTFFWWDVRLHPRLGTLEVRAMDSQSRLDDAEALGGLVHALARACAAEAPPVAVPPVEVIAESSYRAGRDGTAATLWWDERLRPVAEIAERTAAWAQCPIGLESNGAERQRGAHQRGGMAAVLRGLVAETQP